MKMAKLLSLLVLAASASALVPASLAAQAVPITGVIPFGSAGTADNPGNRTCSEPTAVALADGRFAVAAAEDFESAISYSLSTNSTFVEIFDPAGRPAGGATLDSGRPINDDLLYSPALAADGRGGFVAAWNLGLSGDDIEVWTQRFGPAGTPASAAPSPLLTGFCHIAPRVAANALGQFVVAAEYAEPVQSSPTRISVQAFDAASQPVTPRLFLAPRDPAGILKSPRVAIDELGRFSVLWSETVATGSTPTSGLWGQRFRRDGQLLGAPFKLPKVGLPALLPDGQIVLAWKEAGGNGHLLLGWYTRGGLPAGASVDTGTSGVAIDLATDRHGNLALLTKESGHLEVRLFNRALVPQGDPIWIEPVNADPWPGAQASVALSNARRLLVSWIGPRETPGPEGWVKPLLARLWKVSYDADVCVRRDNLFLCDTKGDGGAPEATIDIGNSYPRAIPLMADWDGDGRAEPCLYQNGTFSCDTAHDGTLAARSPRIGLPGDVPLLGDLDGDGRADPCVWRGANFLCDLARNGGAFDLTIHFGQAGDLPLLGDVDGDGRADPCVYRGRRFLCDTAHNGGAAEVTLDLRTALAGTSGTPLLGDTNGDGRADACVWRAGQLTCGVFRAGGGQPLRTFTRLFGRPGDVPLLGDLDAF